MTIREAVREYLRLGWRPMPINGMRNGRCSCGDAACKERDWGKHAVTKGDEDTAKEGHVFVESNFDGDVNVALMMGMQRLGPWLVALDADGPFDWARLGPLPPTRTQKTPRGEHRIFSVPDFCPLGNWVKALESPCAQLDLRYARGRIVVAPSRNAFGEYRWIDLRMPAPLPQTAIDVILRERRKRGLPVLSRWAREGRKP